MKPPKKFGSILFKKSVFKRRIFFFLADIVLLSLSVYAAFWLRFNGNIPPSYQVKLPYFIILAVSIKLMFLLFFNLYDISWRFVSLQELVKIVKALTLSAITLGTSLYFLRLIPPFRAPTFPRSAILMDFLLSLLVIGGLRIAKRAMLYGIKTSFNSRKEQTNVLIIGAGSTGEHIAREIKTAESSPYFPLGFIDDDPLKHKLNIHGIKVLGNREAIPGILESNDVDEILIALPSAASKVIREIVQQVQDSNPNIKIKIVPSTHDLIDGRVTLSDLHEVQLKDLLGRTPANIDLNVIEKFIINKTVLITGAAGSIGSELAKSLLKFAPKTLLLFEIDETELLYLLTELRPTKTEIIPVIGDIKDKSKLEMIFAKHSPQIILHAAAYKHVPILEYYPEEAIKTNVAGTKNLAEMALKYSVEKFIFISTDKAINPTSIMGSTKRACEEMLKFYNQKNQTAYISVRFGNVLGSRGSVIPLFKEQIKKGGPVTVTHPDMKRYFMITSEAVLLVLEAAAIGTGGEVYVLDMGEQVQILNLAREMIKLSGYRPDHEIPIVFTRIRPGEKLSEEVLTAEEGVEETEYERLLKVKSSSPPHSIELIDRINMLIECVEDSDKEKIVELLQAIVPNYQPTGEDLAGIVWE